MAAGSCGGVGESFQVGGGFGVAGVAVGGPVVLRIENANAETTSDEFDAEVGDEDLDLEAVSGGLERI
ncbi:hypothetical protein [Streptomyces sp. NPDC002587]